MSVYVVVTMTPRPGAGEQLRKVGAEGLPFTRSVPGCLAHDFYQSVENGSFLYVERWESIAAYDAHLGGAVVTRWSDLTDGLIATITIDVIYPERVERL